MFEDLPLIRKGGPEMLMGRGASRLEPASSFFEWQEKATHLRDIYLLMLGEPSFSPENAAPKILREEAYQGVTKRDISFGVGGGERITGYALVPPEASGPQPAVLTLHSSAMGGKDAVIGMADGSPESPLSYALHLARKGFVTFSYDQLSVGDRVLPGAEVFDNEPFCRMHPQWSGRGRDLYDFSCALEVLLAISEVDPRRIGCMGHSQGGGLAIDAMIFEDRLRVGVSNCGTAAFCTSQNPLSIARDRWWIGIPRLRPFFLAGKPPPIDLHERLALIAPKPFLAISASNEPCYGVGPDADWNEAMLNDLHASVSGIYALAGNPSHFVGLVHRQGHSFSPESLATTVEFFNKHL